MFCSTATTIVSGAVAERMKFPAYLILASLVSGLIYPLFGHWAWNGIDLDVSVGWLEQLGFVDFAGSTVVHSLGGWVSLASLMIIGSRTGRFPDHQPPRKIHGSNLPLSVLGAMLLWIGWLGFNYRLLPCCHLSRIRDYWGNWGYYCHLDVELVGTVAD
jgi:Amt family ammonium transporter